MKRLIRNAQYGIAAAAALTLVQFGQAQSADALLKKLVEKGVLSAKEADDLRKDADANFTKAYNARSGLPTWVSSLKLSGDLRGRFEAFHADPEDAAGNDLFKDRNRFRYRARIGVVASLLDNLEAGVRLTSSEPSESFGGDPISGNTTWQNNASYKFVFIDRAYGKWAPKWGDFSAATTIGKMENPFVVSEMVFDPDYAPEGIAQQFSYNLADAHALKLNLAGFVLDELSSDSDDPYLLGAQVRYDGKLTDALQLSLGVAAFMIDNEEALTDTAVPNIQTGNSRTGGALTVQFNPILIDAGVTFNVPSFPMYKGSFPIRVVGEYMNNLAEEERNEAFAGGVSLGKSGKKGMWEVAYRYKYLGANAWYEEFVDSDFGAFRPTATGPVLGGGYGAGTNVRGHIVRAAYSLSDAMTLGVTYFLTDVISARGVPVDELETGRLQVDALWRF